MRILMIHGRAQGGKDHDQLKAIWIKTLKEGFQTAGIPFPGGIQFDFPFYGNKLDEFTVQARLPTPDEIVAKGAGQDLEFEQFMQSALDEMKNRAAISDDEVTAEMDGAALQEKGIQNWGWVQAIARVIDKHLTAASEFTIETFLKDVFLYVNKPAVTKGINKIIEAELTDQPTLVIGHSLGSVVGYKCITNNLDKLNLVKYITVGCPLGFKAVSSKLGLLLNPGGINGWYNAYDEHDVVALNPLDNTYFPTDPAIVNNNRVKNRTDNHHGIIGYLDDVEVAKQIAAALG
jgi:hypothetical protein